MNELQIFLTALPKSHEERGHFLASACGDDDQLRERIARLLTAHEQKGRLFRDLEKTSVVENHSSPSESPGTTIGSFEILEKLGEGGMGTVWIAERKHLVKQRVALKLIKPGLDSSQVLRRFEAERQALALMNHHNIAKFIDAGSFRARYMIGEAHLHEEYDRPYFAMELVKGVPITKYCDETHATLQERLRLFIPVCLAVQHAHQKGIIHRDIKPSNVLVCVEDGKPVPKVIDFGVAKALNHALGTESFHTNFNQIIGTMEYMSPEQVELNPLDIDTRADVYALGVLLFELITGTTPLTRDELHSIHVAGLLRQAKATEPSKPSNKLSKSSAVLEQVASLRRTDQRKLARDVRGDLDWIVIKCLEVDRIRRYDSALALSKDIERHLAHQPIEAGPPSIRYRWTKFLRRNRWLLVAASVFFLLVLLSISGLSWGLYEADAGRKLALDNEHIALQRLGQIEHSNEILGSIFKGLDPHHEQAENKPLRVLLGNKLGQASLQLQYSDIGDSLTTAKLKYTLGMALLTLDQTDRAITILRQSLAARERVLGPEHTETLIARDAVAWALRDVGEYEMARVMAEETLRIKQRIYGREHRSTLDTMNNLSIIYRDLKKYDEAFVLMLAVVKQRELQFGPNDFITLISKNNLAAIHIIKGNTGAAIQLLEDVLQTELIKRGTGFYSTIIAMNNLGTALSDSGQIRKGVVLMWEALRLIKDNYGTAHRITISIMQNLIISTFSVLGSSAEVGYDDLIDETINIMKSRPDLKNILPNFVFKYNQRRNQVYLIYPQAIVDWSKNISSRTVHGKDYPELVIMVPCLTTDDVNKYSSEYSSEREYSHNTINLIYNDPGTINRLYIVANILIDDTKYREALPLLILAAETIDANKYELIKSDIQNNTLNEYDDLAYEVIDSLCGCYEKLNCYDKAETWRQKMYTAVNIQRNPHSATAIRVKIALSNNLIKQKKFDAAEQLLNECYQLTNGTRGASSWIIHYIRSLQGEILIGRQQLSEGQALLLESYRGMLEWREWIPEEICKELMLGVLEQLAKVAVALGRQEDAYDWIKKQQDYLHTSPIELDKKYFTSSSRWRVAHWDEWRSGLAPKEMTQRVPDSEIILSQLGDLIQRYQKTGNRIDVDRLRQIEEAMKKATNERIENDRRKLNGSN
jgi:serine/threonine protein kinase